MCAYNHILINRGVTKSCKGVNAPVRAVMSESVFFKVNKLTSSLLLLDELHISPVFSLAR